VTAQQLEADKFAVDKAKNDLNAAKTKLRVLREFTKEKTLKTLDAAVATAEAKLKADQPRQPRSGDSRGRRDSRAASGNSASGYDSNAGQGQDQ
jgi:hypothetical protein